ncbi:MAG: hypothetical protein LBB53_01125 [Prevotellaceae bacterium]|jgi:hypothetical protein|nr:hypothetical protein [Prevotellaceae bacterium]
MAKYTKEEYALAKKQKKELLNLILKKTGTSRNELIDIAEQRYIHANLDVVTPTERKKFDRLIFGVAQ